MATSQRDICGLSNRLRYSPFFNHLVCVADVRNAKPARPLLLAAASLDKTRGIAGHWRIPILVPEPPMAQA